MTALRAIVLLASLPSARAHVTRLVKGARLWWSGKQIAVIGPTASGKNSFLARLQNQPIPRTHATSPVAEKVKSFRVKLALSGGKEIDIKCKGVINVGGEPKYRDSPSGWISVCKGADVIFYVMTVKELMEESFLGGGRVAKDLEWLLTALPDLKGGSLIHILINKIDQEIVHHKDYTELIAKLEKELETLDGEVKQMLRPYDGRYTGATLISMKKKAIYTLAVNEAFRAVYSAFHDGEQSSYSKAS